ncbi:MAG: hypothetical protein JXA69_17635 [Phycisphaerae bacterium]|nr:hypothetical protein [Phycisphaerae bacterium]
MTGRRIARTFGGGTVAQSVAGGSGYAGLDRFGRVIDLNYTGTGGTLQRYQYGYDAAGNRLYARITQADDGAISHDNDRSYLYRYDALSRLILAERGQITPSASGGTIDTGTGAPVPEARLWRLDNLGNWAGGEVFDPPHDDGTDGSLAWGPDADGGGVPDAGAAWTHHATDRSNRITQITKDTGAGTELAYDLAGNLVSDGTYFLQYDGFNRLVQVNAIGTATLNANGEITGGTPGDVVVQFVYDGLGRLIRTVRPDRTEDHYYDGVRRIQTDVTPAVGDPATDRQYVYSPDYVDEFVAQIDSAGAVFFMLQDGNYNVVALVNAAGAVVEQYAYRPYGSLVAVDSLGSAPVNTAGHQGLFYERFGGQGLAVGATGFYYNRNRFYSPALGRFLQRDPNETAMPLLTAMVTNGQTLMSLFGAFDPESHFADGLNVYLYLGANPLNKSDAAGLDYTTPALGVSTGMRSQLIALGVSGCAGGAYMFVANIYSGMGYVDSAVDAACFAAEWFAWGAAGAAVGEMLFRSAEFLAGKAATVATARATGGGMVRGLYGSATRTSLETLARSTGPTTKIATRLTGPPAVGQRLCVGAGEGADALANAVGQGQMYVARIPNALLTELERLGLAFRKACEMGGVHGTEIEFAPAASEFVAPLFY